MKKTITITAGKMRVKALATVFVLAITGTVAAQSVIYLPVIFKNPPPLPKKGLAVFGPYASTGCTDATAVSAEHWYNWWVHPNGSCADGFVPMFYKASDISEDWYQAGLLEYGQKSGWIMGYNEPNLSWQGDTSPLSGAIAWRQLEQLVEGTDIKLASPVPSQHSPNHIDPYGYTWLMAMVHEYEMLYGSKPRFNAIAWHYYGSASQTKAFLIARHNEFELLYPGVPVWLTEFNPCLTGSQDWQSFMTDVLPWIEAQSWITRYYWFINRPTPQFPETYSPCTLMTVGGELMPAGNGYRGY